MNHPPSPDTEVPTQESRPAAAPSPAPGRRLSESARRQLSPEALAEIQDLAARYPDKLAATLPALYVAQKDFGFVSLSAMQEVAKALGVPEGHVFGVATFYTMFSKKPVGKYHIQVCTNLSCALNGATELLERLCARTGATPEGGPTPDGLFSVETVECLGSCGSGPCLQVNEGRYDECVDDAALDRILEACRSGARAPWGA